MTAALFFTLQKIQYDQLVKKIIFAGNSFMIKDLGQHNIGYINIFKSYSVLILLIANLTPVLGVVFLGWDVFSIILLYLTEYFIVGFFSVLKIIVLISRLISFSHLPLQIKIFFIGLFAIITCISLIILWGFFSFPFAWLLIFLRPDFLYNNLLSTLRDAFINTGLIFAAMGILFSHSFSFYYDFIVKNEAAVGINNIAKSLIMIFIRIFFIYPVIFTGGLVALFFGNLPLLLAFIIYKTLVDIIIFAKEHNLKLINARSQ